jgi:hypothetical protein
MTRLATLLVAAGAFALAFVTVSADPASAGWRRGGYGYYGPRAGVYVGPGYGYYGYGYRPYRYYGPYPYAYYPYWRGRRWRY